MARRGPTEAKLKKAKAAFEATKTAECPTGSVTEAAKSMGLPHQRMSEWLKWAGVKVKVSFTRSECVAALKGWREKNGRTPTRDEFGREALGTAYKSHWRTWQQFVTEAGLETAPKLVTAAPAEPERPEARRERLMKMLRGSPTLDAVATRMSVTRGQALDLCDELRAGGFNVMLRGDRVSLEQTPAQLPHDPDLHVFEADEGGRYRFGFVTDNHLGSKYAREDVLHSLYDWFAKEGITRVYNAGNWIDGEVRFNRHDLLVHGMDAQLKYFAERYPQRAGITTYYIAGDDHEGWYAKDSGVDIGRRAEQTAREMGRNDLRYLGYMEAYVTLRNKRGAESQLLVVHPGGGSSYAISYAPQKFVEALQGGEKPAVVLFGHWHKMDCFNYRNVWIAQGGTTEDQTPFMRKKKLEAHVGGMIVELVQDERGAITECVPRMRRYFDRGYYNDQFSMSGDINRAHHTATA